jgi:hypothetical protein
MIKAIPSILRTLLITLAALVIVVPSVSAQSGGDKKDGALNVAVLNLEGSGVDAKLLETLTSVLRNEAQQHAGYDVVNQSPVNLSEIVVVLGCDTNNPECLEQAAEQLDARVLIYGRVVKVEQAHQVTIEIFDANSAKFERRLVRTLANNADPVVAFRRQTQSIFDPDVDNSGTRLTIGSSVDGATVKINDTMIGNAPVERKGLPPGTYEVEVSNEGYEPWTKSVDLIEGGDIRLWAPLKEVEPEKVAPGPVADKTGAEDPSSAGSDAAPGAAGYSGGIAPPKSGVGSGPNWGAWSAVGVGGLAVGASLVFGGLMSGTQDDLTAHDARRSELNRDEYIAERDDIVGTGESYELAHRVLLGVGAVSIIAGTAWLLLDDGGVEEPMAAAPTWDVAVSPTGVSALVSW